MNRDLKSVAGATWIVGSAALGALAMYLSDPDRGRRRRAIATDKVHSMVNSTSDYLNVASRDLGNRAQGLRAQARRMLSKDGAAADDQVLTARVRQKIGRVLSHRRAIHADARQGCVTLSGPILAHEKQQLLDTVRSVQGVTEIEDRLDVHEHAGTISSLQGQGKNRGAAVRDSWPPAVRAITLVGGSVLGMYGLAKRTPASIVLAGAGAALLTRSISNMPFTRLAGMQRGRQAVDLQKTIHVEATPETLFDLWSKLENLPRFMSNIKDVRDLGNGRSHWVVSGPAGIEVEWDAITTDSRRPEFLAWKSEPGSTVQHTGAVRFESEGSGTRVSVHMSYSPPAGVLGHAVASMFNGDPKRQMDEDLMRMKTFIETGNPPADAAKPGQQAASSLFH